MSKWYNKQFSLLLWRPKKTGLSRSLPKTNLSNRMKFKEKKNHKYKKNILKKSANRQNNNKPNCVCCYIVSIWDTKILIFLNRCAATTTSELCIYSVYSIIRADNYGQDETSAAIGMTIQKKEYKNILCYTTKTTKFYIHMFKQMLFSAIAIINRQILYFFFANSGQH